MAIHVILSENDVQSILGRYTLGTLEDFSGIRAGSINSAYWIKAGGVRYFLRITEGKNLQDLAHENALLESLKASGLPVPQMIPDQSGAPFTLWEEPGRYLSIFSYLAGHEISPGAVEPHHVSQVANFAAKMHIAAESFSLNRPNEFGLPQLGAKLQSLSDALDSGQLPNSLKPDVDKLREEVDKHGSRPIADLPQGTVHGDLFIDNVKFDGPNLIGVIDFEMASTDRLVWELAVGINAWCYKESDNPREGTFNPDLAAAFLFGYEEIRPLSKAERLALVDDLRLAAARFAVSRLFDFELNALPPEQRIHKDYRHYLQRLRALSEGQAENIVQSTN